MFVRVRTNSNSPRRAAIKIPTNGAPSTARRTIGWIATSIAAALLLMSSQGALGQDLVAEQLYSWHFQRNDINPSDQMPKGWRRRQDRQHPTYIVQHVVPRDPQVADAILEGQDTLCQFWNIWKNKRLTRSFNPESVPEPVYKLVDSLVNQCVEIRMDGGSAELISPAVPVERGYTYSLDGDIQCEGLTGHTARIELQILDRDMNVLGSYSTESVEKDTHWRSLHCVSNRDDDTNTRFARVHLIVEKNSSRNLSGIARFDDIRINRLPRLMLTSDVKLFTTQPGKDINVYCDAIGLTATSEEQRARFQLLDHQHRIVKEESIPFTPVKGERTPSESLPKGMPRYVSKDKSRQNIARYDGRASWNLMIDTPGYYSVRVYLGKQSNRLRDRELPLAIIDGTTLNTEIPFGWSLPQSLNAEALRSIPFLVRNYGAGKVKVPIWLDTVKESEKIDQVAWLVERLSALNVQCIGVIDQPPPAQRDQFNDDKGRLPIVAVFQDKSVWEPLLDPILSRMSMKLSWFQLGLDDDHSFLSRTDVVQAITDIRTSLQVYAQDLNLAICWPWIEPIPSDSVPWDATQLKIDPELGADELPGYTQDPNKAVAAQWLSLDPLPASRYQLLDRVRDLAERIVAMKKLGVKSAFVTRPMDTDTGLFSPSLEPLPISVPWRTLVKNLAAAKYVGSNVLPGGSMNHVFEVEKDGVMILWSDKPQTEQLYLGDQVQALDLWGRSVEVQEITSEQNQREQRVQVGPWPILITGINTQITKFRMQFELGSSSIPSLVGRDQLIPIKVVNPFAQPIRGRIDLVASTLLQNGVATLPLLLGPDRSLEANLPIQLRSDASAGKHMVRFDFEIQAQQNYQFSTYHELSLGFDDIDLQWFVVKESDKRLTLRMEANNKGQRPITFECKLFPSPYPYQSFIADDLPVGTTNREFPVYLPEVVADAEYWIRCEEIGTRRTLNYRVKVAEK